ncbi:MAG: CBS domain-containing protein, partial [Bacteroidota bacterium]|nr:CBS domain-containing protein [Bacteroidota bacterium]
TTAQMAMGDALAVALLSLRGFTEKEFAQFHPGGSLGKQLYLKVSDIYPSHQRPEVNESANLKDIILEMTSKRLGMTAVTDSHNNLVGIITDGDLRRMLQSDQDFAKILAKDILSSNPKTVASHEMAVYAMGLMQEFNITQLLVVDEGQYLGVIHLHDLIKEGIL